MTTGRLLYNDFSVYVANDRNLLGTICDYFGSKTMFLTWTILRRKNKIRLSIRVEKAFIPSNGNFFDELGPYMPINARRNHL